MYGDVWYDMEFFVHTWREGQQLTVDQVAAFTEGSRCLPVRAKVQNRGSQEAAYSA